MTGPTDNIEVVARAVCAKSLAHDGQSDEQLATDVEMYWHVVASYLEAGAMDETGREIGDLSWDEKADTPSTGFDGTRSRRLRGGMRDADLPFLGREGQVGQVAEKRRQTGPGC